MFLNGLFRQFGHLNFEVVSKGSVEVGIDEVRMMLNFTWIDEVSAGYVVKSLQEYRKEYDEELGVYRSKPLHNWASDMADAIRTLAMSYRQFMGNMSMSNYVGDKDVEEDMFFKEEGSFSGDNIVRRF